MIEFPKDFLWGAATSAYQVEGGNIHCDWWEWEKRTGLKEVSGPACRHYEFFRQDFDLAKELNHNAHRLSIEWSRIEPEEGKFSAEAISHYIEVIDALKQRNLEPVVTLHHFTNPIWFAKSGGWQNKHSIGYFLRYSERITEALCEKVKFWITINEPMVYIYHSYLAGFWPPQERSIPKANAVFKNMLFAHIKAYRLIHAMYRSRSLPECHISIAKNLQAVVPCAGLRNKVAAWARDRLFNFKFLNQLFKYRCLDYIGVNYYTRNLVDVRSWSPKRMLLDVCREEHSEMKKNFLNWDIYPKGFYELLIRLKAYKLPVLISENGICTHDDGLRQEFIQEHLHQLGRAMQKGLRVLGYFYWSLMDNYEWDKGFGARFGLIEVDYHNFKRTPRESAKKYAKICKEGLIE